ncbi:MAG TPA: hypothetical protein VEV17_16225 [Bryobacteraceae bacterium]|nr:hypothetical protein [Bryobacteraceae bacterium]
MLKNSRFPSIALGALLAVAWIPAHAQGIKDVLPPDVRVQRNSGDSLQPVFDGWQRNPDGTISMWFGYYNRNSQEELDVPVGLNNSFDVGGADRGQPTHFYTKRRQYVFKVDLPKDWDPGRKLTWKVTSNGETCTAIGWMQPEWETNDGVRQMNAGAGLAPPADPPNTAPKITGGSPDQTVPAATPLKLTVSATDDGIPKPRAGRGGVGVKWILYRGPGAVSFEPAETPPVYGKPVESATQVTFSAPGSYWLEAIVSDGLLEAVHNVKVTVTSK